MKKLVALYFSGTGNTKFVTEYLCDKLKEGYETAALDITQNHDFFKAISGADAVLFAFPIYGSAPPIPMRNFAVTYAPLLKGKTVAIAETQYFFSGDGSASLGRALIKRGATISFSEHFNMPNNIADGTIFKVRNGKDIDSTIDKACRKMDRFAQRILSGKKHKRGFGVVSHAVGYFCQRKWWRKSEAEKRWALKVDKERCVSCGLCAKSCPVNNLSLENGRIVTHGDCVFCYRCVSLCPKQAITLFGSEVVTQYKGIRKKPF